MSVHPGPPEPENLRDRVIQDCRMEALPGSQQLDPMPVPFCRAAL